MFTVLFTFSSILGQSGVVNSIFCLFSTHPMETIHGRFHGKKVYLQLHVLKEFSV